MKAAIANPIKSLRTQFRKRNFMKITIPTFVNGGVGVTIPIHNNMLKNNRNM